MPTAERKLCGQVSGAPSEVAAQSWLHMSAAISPFAAKNVETVSALKDMPSYL
jgi:hypothetical protein